MLRPFRRLAAVTCLTVSLAACGGSSNTVSSGQEAYDRGVDAFERGKHARAVDHFRTALDFGRTSEFADDAQLYLARSYAGSRQYLLAGNEFTRFVEFYRTDPRVEEAAFERIQAYAALSPNYDLDQTDTRRAIQYIEQFQREYPQSEHALGAAELRAELRARLARKQFETGRLYARREYYEAAVIALKSVLEEYPESEYADDALMAALENQVLFADNSIPSKQEERYGEAIQIYNQFISIFPSSPLIEGAEAQYDRAYRGQQAVALVTEGDSGGPRQLVD
ncbi:MAG: outer membrane protein assembly factor BamD [Rubricoccaceae bacterium]